MAKVMEVTAITPTGGEYVTYYKLTYAINPARFFCGLWITLLLVLLYTTTVLAGDWDITPRISVAEIYSDNINLDDNDKEYDLVTEITPGISLRGEGARLRADLDYQMQNTIFLKNSDGNGTFHQLNANGTA